MFNLSRVLREGVPNPRPFIPEPGPYQPPQRQATPFQYRLLLIIPENIRFVGVLGHTLMPLCPCILAPGYVVDRFPAFSLFPMNLGPELNHYPSSVNLPPGNWPTSTPML